MLVNDTPFIPLSEVGGGVRNHVQAEACIVFVHAPRRKLGGLLRRRESQPTSQAVAGRATLLAMPAYSPAVCPTSCRPSAGSRRAHTSMTRSLLRS